MPRAADGAGAPSSFASLERTLDRTIECLIAGPQNREARALLIEARRLRSVIANWRSIPPPSDVRDEMLERVVQLSTMVGAAFPEVKTEIAAAATQGSEGYSIADEETEGYALDFEPQLYSLEGATNPKVQAVPVPAPERPRADPQARLEPRPDPQARLEPRPDPQARPVVRPAAGAPAVAVMRGAPERASPPLAEPVRSPPQPAAEAHDSIDAPVNSEEEPTQAWSNASLQAPADLDLEVGGPGPAPWPVEEPPERISSIITMGRSSAVPPQPVTRPSNAPPPFAPAPAVAEAARPSPAPAQPRLQALSSPDLAAGEAPRVLTYEFDPEGDDLSVPRTQIAAHAVRLSDPVDPLLVVLAETYSPRADAYRTLRRKLAANPALRVLGVTSAGPGEGKTVFAVNLALVLRENTKNRVLIVEANLRTPTLSKILGFAPPECFLQQIQRHAEDPRAPWVVAEPLPKLHVMAIDPETPHDPALDQVTFSAGMERLKQAGYDYVIVDSPPVLGSLDCNVIADCVDGMIFTALPMKSLRRLMRKAVEQLEPAPILGVVVLEA